MEQINKMDEVAQAQTGVAQVVVPGNSQPRTPPAALRAGRIKNHRSNWKWSDKPGRGPAEKHEVNGQENSSTIGKVESLQNCSPVHRENNSGLPCPTRITAQNIGPAWTKPAENTPAFPANGGRKRGVPPVARRRWTTGHAPAVS